MNRDAIQVLTEWLVLAAQSGDENAFTQLHALWQNDLKRFAVSRVRHPQAADEIANDVWLSISRGIAGLDDPACFPRWAFRIVQFRSTDWIRRRSQDRQRAALAAHEADQLAPEAPIPTDESNELSELRAAVDALPDEQRELVRLHYVFERSIAEIAEILDLPAGTIKSRLFSAREKLRQIIERKSHE